MMRSGLADLDGLPGAELITQGLEDISAGDVATRDALLVWIAGPRLRRLNLPVPSTPDLGDDAELLLYRLLCREGGDEAAYATYNSLLRRLTSFVKSLQITSRSG